MTIASTAMQGTSRLSLASGVPCPSCDGPSRLGNTGRPRRCRSCAVLILVCVTCSSTFQRDAAEHAKKQRKGIRFGPFCSKACVRASPGGPAVTRICPCGRTFKPRGHKPTRRHCSVACVALDRKKRYPDRPCGVCGTRMHIVSIRTKFCSRKCQAKAHSLAMRGAGNSNYSGRSKPYFGGLWERMQPLIRMRDGNACAVCHATRGKRALPVHHIDENPANNTPTNLITLCHACHTTYHRSSLVPFCL